MNDECSFDYSKTAVQYVDTSTVHSIRFQGYSQHRLSECSSGCPKIQPFSAFFSFLLQSPQLVVP